jgi:hypothetical protein
MRIMSTTTKLPESEPTTPAGGEVSAHNLFAWCEKEENFDVFTHKTRVIARI